MALSINEADAKEVKDHFERHKYNGLEELLIKKRDSWISIPIHVAISGESGTGKSSFINTIRAVKADDKNGAALNVRKTTIEPIPYPHPNKHYLKFWDLPQLNSPAFSKDLYIKNVNFDKYNCFLLFTSSQFTDDDFWFAQQIQNANKKCLFVRTHTELDVEKALQENSKSEPRDVQISTLTAIRKGLIDHIKLAKLKPDYVYLITNTDARKFDFPKLVSQMIDDLADRKWEAMALTVNILAEDIIKRKRMALQKRLWLVAILSSLEGALHIYGLQYDVDIELVINEAQEYRRQFGLDEGSLLRVARTIDTTPEILKKGSSFKTNYTQLADGGLLSMYKAINAYDVAKNVTHSFSPILGALVSGNATFGSTYFVLNKLLDMMEADALRMIEFVKYLGAEL